MQPMTPPPLIPAIHTRVGETDVHVLDVRLASLDHDGILSMLSVEESARAYAIRSALRRRQFLATRAVVRVQIGRILEIDPAHVSLRYGRWGKPEVADPRGSAPQFNVAHSGDLAVVVLARDSVVGVDIERVRADRAWNKLLERICKPPELAEAQEEAGRLGVRGFYDRWVAKEAVLKALGCGLGVSPAEVRLWRGVDDALSISAVAPYTSTVCELSLIPIPGYAAALAVGPHSAGSLHVQVADAAPLAIPRTAVPAPLSAMW
jgi:4'-phosphopantetheinyl transferase